MPTIVGTSQSETLNGSDGDDEIFGGGGNDNINGGAGKDWMEGGDGDDVFVVDNAGDNVVEFAGGGTDRVNTSLAAYTLTAHVERLVYNGPATSAFSGTGNGLNNYIQGWNGDDGLNGGGGADTLVGLGGNDAYLVDNAGDVVTEQAGQGTDIVYATVSSYTLPANVENLTYTGNVLFPFSGEGNALANTITGWNGNDTLDGKGGADTLIGRGGNDTYRVDHAGDTVVELANQGTDKVITTLTVYGLGNDVENLVYAGDPNASFQGSGNPLANRIEGWNGHDNLNGAEGADTLIGMLGDDLYWIDNAADVVIEAANQGDDRVNTFLT